MDTQADRLMKACRAVKAAREEARTLPTHTALSLERSATSVLLKVAWAVAIEMQALDALEQAT
jgi:hypothetical protein